MRNDCSCSCTSEIFVIHVHYYYYFCLKCKEEVSSLTTELEQEKIFILFFMRSLK